MTMENITLKVTFIVFLIVVATSYMAQALTIQNMERETGAAYLFQRSMVSSFSTKLHFRAQHTNRI